VRGCEGSTGRREGGRRPGSEGVRAVRGQPQRGFTLIEIMLVVVILGVLLSYASVRLVGQRARARRDAAVLQITTLTGALELYRDRTGDYPTQRQGLAVLREPPASARSGAGGGFLTGQGVLTDPWGRPYIYLRPGPRGHAYEVVSYGRDGRPGGGAEDADLSSSEL